MKDSTKQELRQAINEILQEQRLAGDDDISDPMVADSIVNLCDVIVREALITSLG